jgi:hypothetical protein
MHAVVHVNLAGVEDIVELMIQQQGMLVMRQPKALLQLSEAIGIQASMLAC